MKRTQINVLLLITIVLLASCSSGDQASMMRNVSGKAGEMVIVIAPEIWNAAPGKALRDAFNQPQVGLPQDEPLFSVINIPKEGYADIFKTTRNIVETNISSSALKSEITYKRNVHAYTQAMVTITAKNQQEMEELIRSNTNKMIEFFLQAERERLSMNYAKYQNKAVRNQVETKFGININVPPGFNVDKQTNDFMWIRYETPSISQGIVIYSYPYEHDSTFTAEYLVAKRNVILKQNIPGPGEGSYMTTENEVSVIFNVLKKNKNYAAEMRGLWKVENDFMGGPFVSLSILDLLKNRVITLDGYVYAPENDKRDLIRQVEAMIYSVAFIEQENMDKLNKQFEE